MQDHPFALFIQDQKGPLFRGYCDDLQEGSRQAQELADEEGFPFFIFCFRDSKNVATFEPRVPQGRTAAGQVGISSGRNSYENYPSPVQPLSRRTPL